MHLENLLEKNNKILVQLKNKYNKFNYFKFIFIYA